MRSRRKKIGAGSEGVTPYLLRLSPYGSPLTPYALLSVAALLLFSVLPAAAASGEMPKEAKMTIVSPGVDGSAATVAHFNVEIAAGEMSVRRGLSGREAMPEENGMLFLLGEGEYYFWMKGMRYPLDFVVFDRKSRVIDIIPERQPCERCPLIAMPEGTGYVLEINAGLSKKLGIRAGDVFEIKQGEKRPGRRSGREMKGG
ncbi:MAG: DUF192 domain-containing protein [Nitrospiraceae bacterium]|nr:DUF192 domain-containing protein [Nitrospiraceae bacterium]